MYKFYKSVQKQMSDFSKRNLRLRKSPKPFDQEIQDPDPYGYGRPPYTKDNRTPSQQLNYDAKILVKFINHANKSLREHEQDIRRKELQNIKEPVVIRERKVRQSDASSEVQKRPLEGNTQIRLEISKKSKELYNSKSNLSISDQLPKKNEAFLNKIKTLTMESASNMRFLELALSKNKGDSLPMMNKPESLQFQGRQTPKQEKAPQELSGKKTAQSNSSQGSFFFKDKQKAQKANELEEKLGLQPSDFSSSNKIFKRSAYHVAICYHIYLKKLRQKGPIVSEAEIDPTYHARKLKEEMNKKYQH